MIAKSNVILDVKPWDDETDLVAMEAEIRKIETEGLLWGKADRKPVAFGVFKLVICAVVEDDKVSDAIKDLYMMNFVRVLLSLFSCLCSVVLVQKSLSKIPLS